MGLWRFMAENAKVTHILEKKKIKTGQMVANIRLQTSHFFSTRSSGQGEKKCSSMSAIVEIYENKNISAELIKNIQIGDKFKCVEGTMEKIEFEKDGVKMHKTCFTALNIYGKYTPESVRRVSSDNNGDDTDNSERKSGKKFNVEVEQVAPNAVKLEGNWYKITPKTKGVKNVNAGNKVNIYYAVYGNKNLLNAMYVVNS